MFKHFIAEVKTQLECKIKILRTDQGRKYLSDIFKEFCEEKGYTKIANDSTHPTTERCYRT